MERLSFLQWIASAPLSKIGKLDSWVSYWTLYLAPLIVCLSASVRWVFITVKSMNYNACMALCDYYHNQPTEFQHPKTPSLSVYFYLTLRHNVQLLIMFPDTVRLPFGGMPCEWNSMTCKHLRLVSSEECPAVLASELCSFQHSWLFLDSFHWYYCECFLASFNF